MIQSKFIQVTKYLSLNNFLYNNEELINLSKVNNKDDINNILINYDELTKFFNNDIHIIKFLYNNEKSINKILYDKEENIKINNNNIFNKDKINLSYLFYLVLLMRHKTIINYTISFEFIQKINELHNINKGNIYYEIFLSKITIKLINNYKNSYESDEFNPELTLALDKMLEDNSKIIKNNFDNFKQLDLNWTENIFESELNIDELYIDLIIALIRKKKLYKFEETLTILNQLDIENIDLNKTMFDKLNNFFKDNEHITNDYMIEKIKDLLIEEKINFYFILLKYIIKNSIFIIHIDFLSQTKNYIIKLIKRSIREDKIFYKNENIDDIVIKKMKYILEIFFDSQFYNEKYLNVFFEKLKNENKEETKIKEETSINENNEKENISNSNNVSSSSQTIYNALSENTSNLNSSNHSGFDKKRINNLSYLSSYNLNSSNQTNNNMNTFREENDDFEKYYIIKYIQKIEYRKIYTKNKNINNNCCTVDFIKKINHLFVCFGAMNGLFIIDEWYKIKNGPNEIKNWVNSIFMINNNQANKSNKDIEIIVGDKDKIFIYNLSNNKFINRECHKINLNNLLFLIESGHGKENLYCCSENELNILIDFSFEICKNKNSLIKSVYKNCFFKSGIKLFDFLYIFKSNRIANKGKDKLLFYNFSGKKEIKSKIKEKYSFIFSSNGITVFPKENTKNEYKDKLILFACKKYLKKQKNGILVINISNIYNNNYSQIFVNDNNINMNYYFYNTSDFEVYCFCPISLTENKVVEKERTANDSGYFLIGGFDLKRHKGGIKLFKVNYGKKYYETKIEFVADVIFEKTNEFKGFKKPISCILQSNKDEKLLISCWDGNIYLFKISKINNFNKLNKENILFNEFFEKE